ncbi:MAG: 2-amino-4-hydroxy-6-hydroxymethyldihydropteridine diphosphokinase [Oscillospiraceae bacterium]|jgi:2-amino-4-hydroxy-6-hydroxymethyldihydropteridine diphosphokinase|nr:2-amino-4-hydroxy-6-hydroxymethyldihydropteridine diphosphokinase [Oscillospiraceae bacterium]
MKEAVIGLGSNLFDRKMNIKKSFDFIDRILNTKIRKISKFYETKPYKVSNKQRDYINCCVSVKTELSPLVLLGACLGIEAALGRERFCRFSSRTIDIDLICFESFKICTEELCLPHPRAHERLFVLLPLFDLYPKGVPEAFCFKTFKKEIFENKDNFIKGRFSSLNDIC